MFRRLFIANRGEVAVRIARTCKTMGITPVFAASEADRDAPYLHGEEVVTIGPAPAKASYLQATALVQAAVQSRCAALHPGWGFLSEDPLLATLCANHGVTFVGAPATVMAQMGKKSAAKAAMHRAGLPVIPGPLCPLADVEAAVQAAAAIGYPVLLKAESGGGGRGMRRAADACGLQAAFAQASAEAAAAFGDARLYLEKELSAARHIEVQLLADFEGRVLHLGERECSVQRKHQKLLEESPSLALDADMRQTLCQASVQAAAAIGYRGAGTMEFLLDADAGALYFIEMNTRLQVEHGLSELRSGIDLVEQQLCIAAGQPLALAQQDIVLQGHALQCRINAEDPAADFRPSPGRVATWQWPTADGRHLRLDTHIQVGAQVSPHYDSLLAKLMAWAPSRAEAIAALQAALAASRIEGVATTTMLHQAVLADAAFARGDYSTAHIPGWPPSAHASPATPAASPASQTTPTITPEPER